MQEGIDRTPRPLSAIRRFLRSAGVRTHEPSDGCGGCHKAEVIRDLMYTSRDLDVFRFFLRPIMEAV